MSHRPIVGSVGTEPDPHRIAAKLAGCAFGLLGYGPGIDGAALVHEVRRSVSIPIISVPVDEPGGLVLGPPPGVPVAVRRFPATLRVTFSRARAMVAALADDLGLTLDDLANERRVVLSLTERGAGGEEILAAALSSCNVDLVGANTLRRGLALDGVPASGGSVVAMIGSSVARTLSVHPFFTTETRTVVTDCDRGGRRVTELDGQPAAQRYAELAEISSDVLRQVPPEALASLPVQLGWMLAGHLVARPVVGVFDDALWLGAAVERGTVLRVLRRSERVRETLQRRIWREVSGCRGDDMSAWLFGCPTLLDDGLLDGLCLPAVGMHAGAQQYGPVHAANAVVGLVWGADAA